MCIVRLVAMFAAIGAVVMSWELFVLGTSFEVLAGYEHPKVRWRLLGQSAAAAVVAALLFWIALGLN